MTPKQLKNAIKKTFEELQKIVDKSDYPKFKFVYFHNGNVYATDSIVLFMVRYNPGILNYPDYNPDRWYVLDFSYDTDTDTPLFNLLENYETEKRNHCENPFDDLLKPNPEAVGVNVNPRILTNTLKIFAYNKLYPYIEVDGQMLKLRDGEKNVIEVNCTIMGYRR